MSYDIKKIRDDFPVLRRSVRGKPLVYLDSAATSLKPQCVIDAVSRYYTELSSNVHRGLHYLSEESTNAYEDARDKIQRFIGSPSREEIIFTRGATEAINIVAQSYGREFIKEGDEILISHMEHHSNIVPWQILCKEKGCILKVIPITDRGEIVIEEYLRLLGPKTKIVAVTYVSNALGTINPVKEIVEAAHKQNVPVLIDGAQAVNELDVNVSEMGCDFFAFSGHKMFGPTGVGVLYAKAEHLELMPPVQGGGDMISSVTIEKTSYNSLPYKFEAGTPNIAGVIGLGSAVDYISKIGFNNIAMHARSLLGHGKRMLEGVPGLKIIGKAADKKPVFSFLLDDIHPHDIGSLLDEDAIAIRAGHHCAQPLMKRMGIVATARASLSIYNTEEEIDMLAEALIKVRDIFK